MSDSNTIQKKHFKRDIQASPSDVWRNAPRPNYSTNADYRYPYSEYPRTFDAGHEYYSTQLTAEELKDRIVDFWGEGRIDEPGIITGFKNAYNINHQFQLVSNGKDKDKKIPNRIPTKDYADVSVAKYVPDHSVDIITLMGAPIYVSTANEIARMIRGNDRSVIVIYGFQESDDETCILERALSSACLVLSPLYELSDQLKEVTLKPQLAFCQDALVVSQATRFFKVGNMSKCGIILRSLLKSSANQATAEGALKQFFAQDDVRNNYLIFKLGYELNNDTDGRTIMSKFMNGNVAKIVRGDYTAAKLVSNFSSVSANLCVNKKVPSSSWQWAFFGTSQYINGGSDYKGGDNLKLVPVSANERFKIQSDFGSQSFLCTNGRVPSDSWQWAFFGTPSYVNSSTYNGGHEFYLDPINGGEQFRVRSAFGETAYLCSDGKVSSGSWQWAFFGTWAYVNNSTYRNGTLFSLMFD